MAGKTGMTFATEVRGPCFGGPGREGSGPAAPRLNVTGRGVSLGHAPVPRAPDPQSKFLEKCFSGFAWRRSWGAQWEVRGRGIGAGGVPMFSNSSAIASCQPPFCCPACKPDSSEAACERTAPPGCRFSRTLSGGPQVPPPLCSPVGSPPHLASVNPHSLFSASIPAGLRKTS